MNSEKNAETRKNSWKHNVKVMDSEESAKPKKTLINETRESEKKNKVMDSIAFAESWKNS